MLVWEGYQDPKASAAFRSQNDVTVQPQFLTTNAEMFSKLLAGGTSQISLLSAEISFAPLLVQAGVLDPVDWSQLPNTKDYLSIMEKLGHQFAVNGQTYAAPFQWGINTLIYNKKYLPTPPRSWRDFSGPQFTNKIALTDVAEDNYNCWSRVLGYDPAKLTPTELNKVTDFLINLKKQQVRLFSNDYDALARALATGDIVACASPLNTSVPALAKKHGSDTVRFSLIEDSQTWTDSMTFPKGSPNRATAVAWLNYMLGPKANAIVATDNQYGTVNKKSVPLVKGVSATAYPYDNPDEIYTKAPFWIVPEGKNGTASWQDWVNAWKRVEAA